MSIDGKRATSFVNLTWISVVDQMHRHSHCEADRPSELPAKKAKV